MNYFDPSDKIKNIQSLLQSDKKRIGFLFGAGTSVSKKTASSLSVPSIYEITCGILEIFKDTVYGTAIMEIKNEFISEDKVFNVESLLSNIENKIEVIGNGKLNDLTKQQFIELDKKIKDYIQKQVSVHNEVIKKDDICNTVQSDFAEWIKNADRKYGIEIFTTNYDYLLEIALENSEVPYYDGFTGSFEPFFDPFSVENLSYLPQQTKLWKIHGSLGLHQKNNKIVRTNSDKKDLLIYPSVLKYANSRKQPYTSFMDRLNNFLKQDDAVLFVCGYSFGDEHINERIMSALQTDTTAHVYVLYYDIDYEDGKRISTFSEAMPVAKLAVRCNKISVLSSRKAIIGTKLGKWKLQYMSTEDDLVKTYFDIDVQDENTGIPNDCDKAHKEFEGCGEFKLIDFGNFVRFLSSMINTLGECNNG